MSNSTLLNLVRDINGYVTFGLMFPTDIYSTTLAQNTAQSMTVPANYQRWLMVFSFDPGLRVFVARNTTATVPGGSFTRDVSVLNPTALEVLQGDSISFITPDVAAYVQIGLYARDSRQY